jgi:OmcA/MtrC family decaheme c-type cytochrome
MRLAVALFCLAACEGPAGPAGPPGPTGSDGVQGPAGSNGTDGSDGQTPLAPWLTAPGVRVHVTGLTFDSGGAHVTFTLADPFGVPLDRTGLLTDTKVSVGFVLAQLAQDSDGSPAQYTAYTTRVQTSPITNQSATQATTESIEAGFTALDVSHGSYSYTFTAPLTGLDPTLTQTVLASAVRGTDIARDTFSVRADGGTTVTRQEVTDAACDGCHATLAAHGGRYTSPSQCVLCHQPQSSDPDTGNTVDFKVMIHKIHRGLDLPSVVAGGTYEIIGYGQSVNDFSTVEFPQDIARCTACHDPAAQQPNAWGKAGPDACTSCHDTTTFTAPANHGGGVITDATTCKVCHPQSGSIAGITDKHFVGLLAPSATQVALAIQSITNTAPGQIPVVTFQATVNGAPRDLGAQPLTRLTATIAGPTTDETTEWAARIQGTGAVGTLTAVDPANGIFSYTFPTTGAVPVGATGTYTVGLEGYVQATSTDPRFTAHNPTLEFAVTGTPVPRRQIVDVGRCNGCHFSLQAHGGARNDPRYCVLCHNTALQNNRVTLEQGASALAFTLDFRSMIHKIHMGENLTQGYAIGTSDFSGLRYPRAIQDCSACHTAQNWALPLASSIAYAPSQQSLYTCPDPVSVPGTPCSVQPGALTPPPSTPQPLAPQASVCTSCHDAAYTLAHAQVNTTLLGVESCATCHGPGMDWDVVKVHSSP